MAWKQGIYFRATDNRTDPTDYDAEIVQTANYPRTSAQGNSVGWEQSGNIARDRGTTTDVRLQGVGGVANSGATKDYRIDLPNAGTYNIRAAFGDVGFSENIRAQFFDSATLIADSGDLATLSLEWYDATFVKRSGESTFLANNAARQVTFSSTIFRVRLGAHSSGTLTSTMAFVEVEQVASTNTLTAGTGSFTETGQTVTLTTARKLAATAGSFTLTGQDVTLTGPGSKTLTAAAGSFTLTGQDVNFELAVEAGIASYTLTGQTVGLKVGRKIAPAAGSFSRTGQSVTLTESISYTLSAAVASFALTGQRVSFSTTASPWQAVPAASGTWTPVN